MYVSPKVRTKVTATYSNIRVKHFRGRMYFFLAFFSTMGGLKTTRMVATRQVTTVEVTSLSARALPVPFVSNFFARWDVVGFFPALALKVILAKRRATIFSTFFLLLLLSFYLYRLEKNMVSIATARTFKAQIRQVWDGEAERTKNIPVTKSDLVIGKDGSLRTRIPLYATSKTRAGRNRQVFNKRAWMTTRSGLKKEDLVENAHGRIVSKRARDNALKRVDFGKSWREAVQAACDQMPDIEKYTIPTKGSELYQLSIALYESLKKKKKLGKEEEEGSQPELKEEKTEEKKKATKKRKPKNKKKKKKIKNPKNNKKKSKK